MTEPIFDPNYWSDRLARAVAREQTHYAVFEGSKEKWEAGRLRQAALLAQHIGPTESVLDVGCGWGRLLGIMPKGWIGEYLGVDICPEFIALARAAWPNRRFWQHDFRMKIPTQFITSREISGPHGGQFTWAVCCSIKPMVVRNAGQEEWGRIEANIRLAANRILLLGYDDLDDEEGVI